MFRKLGKTLPFHQFTILLVINWFIFGRGVAIYDLNFPSSILQIFLRIIYEHVHVHILQDSFVEKDQCKIS